MKIEKGGNVESVVKDWNLRERERRGEFEFVVGFFFFFRAGLVGRGGVKVSTLKTFVEKEFINSFSTLGRVRGPFSLSRPFLVCGSAPHRPRSVATI